MKVIEVRGLTIDLPVINQSSRSIKRAVLNMSTGGRIMKNGSHKVAIRAPSNISLDVQDGDRIGLVGHNGAGKTTLLRALAGIYSPSAGRVAVTGEISAAFELLTGLDMDSTGEENIVLLARYRGISRATALAAVNDIADFTELGAYLNLPVRTYSQGMLARLAFAVATSFQPDILLMDEWIATGDEAFIRKAQQRLETFVAHSRVMVLASHNTAIVRSMCNKVLWLEAGSIKAFGTVDEVWGAVGGPPPSVN